MLKRRYESYEKGVENSFRNCFCYCGSYIYRFFVFGNAFPSNIDNQAWAGFLGSYLGGIATLVAVFITISDNNKKIEIQRQSEKEQLAEQKNMRSDHTLIPDICFLMRSQKLGLMTEYLI